MNLNGTGMVNEQTGDPWHVLFNHGVDEGGEVQPRPHHAQDIFAVPDQNINPELGNAQVQVRVDVDVQVAPVTDQIKKPGVLGCFC